MGSLFRASFFNADDVHMCLDLLVVNPLQLHFLCAMHALIVHCDERLCANEHWPGTSRFCTKLTVHKHRTGENLDFLALINVSRTLARMACISNFCRLCRIFWASLIVGGP